MNDPIEPTVTLHVPTRLLPAIQELLARHEAAHVSGSSVPRKSIPLSYESSWAPMWRWWHAWPAVLALTLFVTSISVAAWMVVPEYKNFFKTFGVELPGSTKIILALSEWMTQGWGWLILLLLAIFGSLGWNYLRRPTPIQQRRAILILIVFLTILAAVFLAFATIALNAPMFQVLWSIGGRRA